MTDRSKQPAVHTFDNVHLDFPQSKLLSNGITTWVIGHGSEEVTKVDLHVRGGMLMEDHVMQANMTATLATSASATHDAAAVAEALDHAGAWKSCQVHDSHTVVTLASLNSTLERVSTLLTECLSKPSFDTNEFEVNQRRIASNYATQNRRVRTLAMNEMRRLYYGERHCLAQAITPEKVMSLDIGQLQSFYRRHYNTANMELVVSGHVTDHEMDIIDRTLGQIRLVGSHTPDPIWEVHPSPTLFAIVDQPGALQSCVVMSQPTVNRSHPDYFKIRLLVTILGGYFGSRLMSNLREEKGYTYGIGAYVSGRAHDAAIGIETECDVRYTHAVIDETRHEIERLRNETVPQAELDNARQYMLGELVKTLDTPFSIASYVGTTILYGVSPEYFNRQVEDILSATPADVLDTARKYLDPDHLRVVVAGDQSKIQT